MDEVDLQLLHLLSEDGRASYAALAREVGLSDGAVRQRVDRLLQAGAAVPVVVLDHERLPRMSVTWFGLRAHPGCLDDVVKGLGDIEEVTYVVLCTGRFHLLGEIRADSLESAFAVASERIAQLPVELLQTFPALEVFKENLTWLPPSGEGPVSV